MKRIATKFWAAMVVLVGFMLLLSWMFLRFTLTDQYIQKRLDATLKSTSSYITSDAALQNVPFHESRAYYNAEYIVLNDQNRVLYRSDDGQLPYLQPLIDSEFYSQLVQLRQGHSSVHLELNGIYYRMKGRVIPTQDGERLLIALTPESDAGVMAGLIEQQLLLISAILIAIAAIIALVLVRGLTRPIAEIKRAADCMADGEMDIALDESGNDEIAELSATINHLGQTLKKTTQLQRELVANISHELRTPLSLIRGYAETVRDVTWKDENKRNRQLNVIIEESERLRAMVDTILDFSQLQAGLLQPDLKNTDIMQLVRDSAELYRPELEREGVTLQVQVQGSRFIDVDADKIRQSLYNLISNASNHTPSGGTVRVQAEIQDGFVQIDICDSGPGIDPAHLEHIWERFYRAPKQEGRRKRGSGLGLALVRGIVESHGGTCGAQNMQGGGARLWLKIPTR